MGIGPWDARCRAWEQLYRESSCVRAYLSPEWVATWLAEFGAELRPVQLCVHNGAENMIGTCLLTERRRRLGLLSLVRVFVNTDGENAADSVITEHNALLSRPGNEAAVYSAVAEYMRGSRADELVLRGARESDVRLLSEVFADWQGDVEWRDSPFVDLDLLRASGCRYRDSLSANTRAHLARALRRYEQRGPLRLEVAQTPEEGVAMLDELILLHEARWRGRGLAGGFATRHRQSFHRVFVRDHVTGGRAQLLRLRCGDSTIGVLYNLVANGFICFYQGGFQYEPDPQLKPGLVTHSMAIEHYLATGYREYDFLPSAPGEGRYKSSLSNATRRLGTVTLFRRSWRTRYFDALRGVRNQLRKLK